MSSGMASPTMRVASSDGDLERRDAARDFDARLGDGLARLAGDELRELLGARLERSGDARQNRLALVARANAHALERPHAGRYGLFREALVREHDAADFLARPRVAHRVPRSLFDAP